MSKDTGFSITSAERYSLALYELSNESNLLTQIEEQCSSVLELINTSDDFKNLIKDPRAQGYKYVTIFGPNRFALVNCDTLINGSDTILNFRLFNTESKGNVHNEYALVSENLGTSTLPKDIENVWFNSLIGYDEQMNQVPDPELSDKAKYGTLTTPRQSWFKNSKNARKILFEVLNKITTSINLDVNHAGWDNTLTTSVYHEKTNWYYNTSFNDDTVIDRIVDYYANIDTSTLVQDEIIKVNFGYNFLYSIQLFLIARFD